MIRYLYKIKKNPKLGACRPLAEEAVGRGGVLLGNSTKEV